MANATHMPVISLGQVAARLSQDTGCAITMDRIWKAIKRHPEWRVPLLLGPLGRRGNEVRCIPEDYYPTLKGLVLPAAGVTAQETSARARSRPRPPVLALYEVADLLRARQGQVLSWHRLHTLLKHPACPVPMASFRLSAVHLPQPGVRRADVPALAQWLLADCPAQPGQLQLPVAQ